MFALDANAGVCELIRHLPPARKRSIRDALRAIAKDPDEGKPLQEELAGLFSFRVGTLRVIYTIDRSRRMVHVIALGPRRSIYEELERAKRNRTR